MDLSRIQSALLLWAWGWGAVSGANAAGAGPITNGGFEVVGPDGAAPGWELLGNARVETGPQAFEGKRALHLVRTAAARGETGLNRAWSPNSGKQNGMLSERKGAIRFRYRAISQAVPGTLTVQVIPMTDKPLEFGGRRVVWRVPAEHVGDGRWHLGEFAYDFTALPEVKWVHVGARLTGPGELWLDAFEWVPEVDAVPQFRELTFSETAGKEGTDGKLEAVLINLGSKQLPRGTVRVRLPKGLDCRRPVRDTPPLSPGETVTVDWRVLGARTGSSCELRLALEAGGRHASAALRLEPSLELTALRCPAPLVPPGQAVRVELVARNTGHVSIASVPGSLQAPAGVTVERTALTGPLLPGREAAVAAWRITVPKSSPSIRLTATSTAAPKGGKVETRLVVAAPGSPPEAWPPAGPYALETGGWVLVGSSKVRLALFSVADGARAGFFQVRRSGTWRTVALLPHLGMLRTPRTEAAPAWTQIKTGKPGVGQAVLTLTGTARLDGVAWRTSCEFRVDAGSDVLSCRFSAVPGSAVLVSAFEGPMLLAGEGLGERDEAILPGLEWLVRGEVSSNALDIKPDHPDRLRYVPHPRKITVPAAAVRFGDIAVGLLWAPPSRQASTGVAGALSLVFASPDRFEGFSSHLMGLMLPGVDRGLGENRRTAATPLEVGAGQALVIEARLVALAGATDALAVLDRWFDLYGVPEPLPFPRGSARAEIKFSLGAYAKDKALWNPKWGKWYSDIIVGFRPTIEPAEELLLGAAVLGDGPVAKWARALAGEVLRGAGGKPPPLPEYRADPEYIHSRVRSAQALVAAQKADGNWVFSGKKAADQWPENGVDYSKLGPAGARAVGLTAANAATVLEAALLSGDPDLRAAGLKALEGMSRFRVPRAAQVWEVPVHTPDILASAKAVRAYLAGYRLTGRRAYLDRAVYWARTGLPFVYVWHAPNLPAMQGGSIPVFGATAYVLSWFAVAVQWNGLAYSSALYDLAEYDASFPWAKVADNILRSAMYQQATEGERFGQWPDAVNFIPDRRGPHGQTPPCFRPTTIIDQTLRGMGIRRSAVNRLLTRGTERLVVRTTAAVTGTQWSGDRLRVDALFRAPQRGAVVIYSLDRPRRVRLNGTVLSELKGPEATAPGWRWIEPERMLEVRPEASGPSRIVIEGVRPQTVQWAARVRRTLDFDFRKGVQGWFAAHALTPLKTVAGVLTATVTGEDPYMVSSALDVPGRVGDRIEVDMAVAGGAPDAVAVYWGTSEAPGFAPERTAAAECPGDGRFHRISIPVGVHPQWRGRTVTVLRLDPPGNEAGTRVRVRTIRLRRAP